MSLNRGIPSSFPECGRWLEPYLSEQVKHLNREGAILQSRYRIVKLESEGGMSFVYKVEDERLNKYWALKELKAAVEFLEGSVEYAQFKTEARILADFSHTAFPSVIDFFLDSGKAYIVEEWIEGKTLESICGKGLPEEKIREITIQLVDALDYIHKKGVVYRDLKPQNIMITRDGGIKLIDFGIARFYKAGKRKDTVLAGTPGYAPPEQYGRGQTDIRTDIYSLGATIYFMVSGIHPPEEQFDIQLPAEYRSKITPELDRVLRKAMKSKPDERFQTLDEIRASFGKEHHRGLTGSVLLLILAAAVFSVFLFSEARVPFFYSLLLILLIYGFVWAVKEIRKGSRRSGKGV